jgi:hypothetical protein
MSCCQRHSCNNCVECAISNQTDTITIEFVRTNDRLMELIRTTEAKKERHLWAIGWMLWVVCVLLSFILWRLL